VLPDFVSEILKRVAEFVARTDKYVGSVSGRSIRMGSCLISSGRASGHKANVLKQCCFRRPSQWKRRKTYS
jgi:hypothetical protein